MEIIDTHCHLNFPELFAEADLLINKAKQTGVKNILIPMTDPETIAPMFELKKRFSGYCHLMAGFHPTNIDDENVDGLMLKLENLLTEHKFIAVGEVGLDFYYGRQTMDAQLRAFSHQINLALKYGLPLALHCRSAYGELFEILEQKHGKKLRGVFHCFSGGIMEAKKAVEMGFKLGIGGVLTFKNAGLAELLKNFTLGDIVVETDAPYLAPAPFRGKRNDSSLLVYVMDKLAEIYGVTAEEAGMITSQNARELFSIV